MLFVLFRLGDDRYALDTREIVEVLPRVSVRSMLRSPPGLLGVFSYRGTFVPAIDLSELMLGVAAPIRFSTRTLVVRHPSEHGRLHLLGLVVEHATETMRCDPASFRPSGIVNDETQFNGPLTTGSRGTVQQVALARLLPPSLRDALFKEVAVIR